MRGIHIDFVGNTDASYINQYNHFINNTKNYQNSYPCDDGMGYKFTHQFDGIDAIVMNVDRSRAKKLLGCVYRPNVGGNFLCTSLSLSSDVLPSFSLKEKIDFICKHYSKCLKSKNWFDLNLCPVSEKRINNDEWCFVIAHGWKKSRHRNAEPYYSFYPNARFLKIENSNKFRMFRLYGDTLGLRFSQVTKMDIDQINSKLNFKNYSYETLKNFQDQTDNDEELNQDAYDYTWNADNYLNLDLFLMSIKKLYNDLELSGYNEDVLSWHYNKWVALNDILYFHK